MVHTRPADERDHSVVVLCDICSATQDDGATTFSAGVAIGRRVKGLAPSVGCKHLSDAAELESVRIMHDVHTRGNGCVSFAY